jgi:hypothetical protein
MGVLRKAVGCGVVCLVLMACSGGEATRPTLAYRVGGCDEEWESSRAGTTGEVRITGGGDVIRVDQKLTYVCCAELELTLEQEGNTIRIMEKNVGELCRCICEYHVEAEVTGLRPGVYDVEVWGVEYEDVHRPELLGEMRVTL